IIIVTVFFLFFSFNNNFSNNFLSIASSISNIGFSLDSEQKNLSFIFLIFVIIGGSFFSTSSGLRFIKIYSLFKYSLNQILSFSKPKNIFMNKLMFTKINFDFNEINKYFLTIIIFILSLLVLTSLLSLTGIDFVISFKLSILTLMNTVNSSMYGINEFDFKNLHYFTKYCLIFFMIVGRIELLTILLLFKKFLFKN
ncbi:TrkH family potassium uptake protein, partial [Pelagibacterales bacterium SAG-MED13]|nr:TrkH family potassium uptake protein [Pelagibacterales bacterium SAG-MED13]